MTKSTIKNLIWIGTLSFCLTLVLGGIVKAAIEPEDTCAVLYEKYSNTLLKYDTNQDKKIFLSESYQAVADWFGYKLTKDNLLAVLSFGRQQCVMPIVENDPVSGTLSVNSTQVKTGENIILTVTGKDNDGLKSLWAYYQGKWHSESAQGTSTAKTFTFSESQPGTYIYKGYVYGSQPSGVLETGWTTPVSVTVTVTQVLECEHRYWFDNNNLVCGYKEFCGTYMYLGLRTFDTQEECEEALADIIGQNDPASGTLSVSSTNVKVGQNIILTVTGKDNDGLRSLWAYYQSTWHSQTVSGTSATQTFTFSESKPGTYAYLGFIYGIKPSSANGDIDYAWTEPRAVTVTVTEEQAVKPDLTVKDIWFDANKTINYTARNTGDAQASTSWTELSVNGVYKSKSPLSYVVAGGEKDGIMGGWTNCSAGLSYAVEICLDTDNEVNESNELNNCLTKQLTCPPVGTGADLIITSVSSQPSAPTVNNTISFSATIKNNGSATMTSVSGGIITKVSSNSLPSPGWRICDAMTSALTPGQTATVNCPTFQTFAAGTHSFTFLVDDGNRLAEINENNNESSFSLSIGSVVQEDLVSGTFSVSSLQAKTGENIVLTVAGQDDQGVSMLAVYYQGQWHFESCPGATVCNKTWTFSEATAGTYYYYGYVYGKTTTGAAESAQTNPYSLSVTVSAPVAACTDTDGGINYYVKGESKSSSIDIEGRVDCCKLEYSTNMGDAVKHIGTGGGACVSNGPYLYEAICQNNIPSMTIYQCPNGCQNGICIR